MEPRDTMSLAYGLSHSPVHTLPRKWRELTSLLEERGRDRRRVQGDRKLWIRSSPFPHFSHLKPGECKEVLNSNVLYTKRGTGLPLSRVMVNVVSHMARM